MERATWGALGARPLVFPALGLGLGAAVAGTPGEPPWILLTGTLLVAVLALSRGERTGGHLLLLVGFIAAGAGLARLQSVGPPPLDPPHAVLLEGRVERALASPDGCRLILDARRGAEAPVGRVRLALHGAGRCPLAGEVLRVRAKLRPLEPAANPGQPELRDRWLREGLAWTGGARADSVVVLAGAGRWQQWMARTQASLAVQTRAVAPSPEAASLFLTLAAGQRAELGDALEETFSASGLAHVLSVSGLHVAALALVLLALLRRLFSLWPVAGRAIEPQQLAAPLAIPLVWGFVAFTGWQPPAVRSALMATGALAGLLLWRRADGLNLLAGSAALLIALDPACIADLSMQLSFLAVLSLILVVPALRAALPVRAQEPMKGTTTAARWIRKLSEGVVQSLCASAAVTLAGAPLIADAFGRLSLAGFVSNVVCMPLCGLLTVLAAGGAGLFIVSPEAAAPVLWAGAWASELLLAAARLFAASPLSSLPVPAPSPAATAVFALGLGAFSLGSGRVRWLSLAAPAAVLWVFVGGSLLPGPGLRITFLSVGQGDGIVISSGGLHALVDAGGVPQGGDTGARYVLPFLRSQGIRELELAALSHPHPDHALGMVSVLEKVPTRRLWLAAGSADGALSTAVRRAAGGARTEEVEVGHPSFRLGEAVIEVLGPPRDRLMLDGVNDGSLVLRVRHGEVTVLLTGDIEEAGEEALETTPVTVLKAPHHGSRTSSSELLLDRARPQAVVISLGRHNRFGFPHAQVLERYAARGLPVFRTDLGGAITLESDGQTVRLASFLPDARGERRPPLALTARRPNVEPDMNSQEPNPEDVDLAALVDELRAALPLGEGVVGYLRGKSLMRDVLVERKGYSALLSEELIDTLENNGYLRFEGDPSERSLADAHWAVGPEFERTH